FRHTLLGCGRRWWWELSSHPVSLPEGEGVPAPARRCAHAGTWIGVPHPAPLPGGEGVLAPAPPLRGTPGLGLELRGVTVMFLAANQGWNSRRSRPALTAGSVS